MHGATPWTADHERRLALYRFAPANMGYGRGYLDIPESALEHFTEQQRAVVEPPYAVRLDRPLVTAADASAGDEAPPTKRPRSEHKKQHDKALFGTSYF